MTKALSTVVLVAFLTAALAAVSLLANRQGYPQGALGLRRLDDIATAATFIPLAAVYSFSALLLMVLPMRAAAFVFYNATEAVFWTIVALFGTIAGVLIARAAFGQVSVLWALADWRFGLTLAVVACHFVLNELGRSPLLRVIGFAAFLAATLLCLFWSFRF
ncbi:hypothetical protein G5V57_23730 [Nordella sp. HKS 07]|uniref:hypothetical protein n=1 Tax=Nordella sp. HKS 07 TaxID=2712222 RepID=UPI0013E1EC3B|nr:hypothetical protein [Nordella sp. HKS 07]QIG50472.1 hypothetical protein G5V57_23730 [Nordella sp. HKS 07]